MNLLIYAVKVIACSVMLFGYYHLFLRNKNFHHYNRFYLLASAACAVLLPLFRIPVFFDSSAASTTWMKSLQIISVSSWEDAFVVTARTGTVSSFFNARNIAWIVYTAGFMAYALPILRSWLYIKKLSCIYKREMFDEIAFYNTREPGTPFSFFRTLFWNDQIPLAGEKGQYILQHEVFHIRMKHSYDVLSLHVLTSLFWFNPFFHILLKELRTIHEFLADEWAGTINKYDYAELLLMETIQGENISTSHSFFHHQIKRRIAMIIKQQPSNISYVSRVMTLPFLFALFTAFTFQVGCRDKTLVPSGSPMADAANGGLKAGTVITPASEFMKIMKGHEQDKGMSFKEDTSSNLLTVTFQDGKSIVTHLDEFRKLNPGNRSSTGNPIFTKVETEASFPGGQLAYMRFLNKTFRYPEEAQAKEIQGPVIVQFIVGKNGDVSDVQVLSGPEVGGLREEAARVIRASGKWTPAIQNGLPVASYKKQPIIFRLDTE